MIDVEGMSMRRSEECRRPGIVAEVLAPGVVLIVVSRPSWLVSGRYRTHGG